MQIDSLLDNFGGRRGLGKRLVVDTDRCLADLDPAFPVIKNRIAALAIYYFDLAVKRGRAINEVALITQGLEANQVIGEQAVENLSRPGKTAEHIGRRKRDMKKESQGPLRLYRAQVAAR